MRISGIDKINSVLYELKEYLFWEHTLKRLINKAIVMGQKLLGCILPNEYIGN